jgi:ParB family chromosome partitioning protein
VRTNEISQGHARALLGLPDQESRVDACRRIVADHLSVRQTEALVSLGAPTPSRPRIRKDPAHVHGTKPPHLLDLELRLNQRLGTTVLIRPKNPDRGQIIIDYHSREEFDRLAALFPREADEPATP